MIITTHPRLLFPIEVTKLLRRTNDEVKRNDPLFEYSYTTTVIEDDENGEPQEIKKKLPATFECETDGKLTRWMIEKGTKLLRSNVQLLEIEEPCTHEVQFGGMCANCGRDMDDINYNTSVSNMNRATINIVHDQKGLKISQAEAARQEEGAKRRLLASRKLSLVVDLDQTIIHATVDPTVAEWQRDPSNPNHDAVKDVKAFQLIDEGPGGRGCWYYIKLRPGLLDFLDQVSRIYELHIYTMGTRAYAQNIAKIVDPERKIFGDRILSRDESGSLMSKSLTRLFPFDTKMVVIIDDRADVWAWNPNLIKVSPYDFFVGIGDINSSFLPKRPEVLAKPEAAAPTMPDGQPGAAVPDTAAIVVEKEVKTPAPTASEGSEDTNGNLTRIEQQLVAMSGGDNTNAMSEQSTKQDEVIAAQMEERPLMQKQKKLEELEEKAAAKAAETAEHNGDQTPDEPQPEVEKPKHKLLRDDDTELMHLEGILRNLHQVFYIEYEKNLPTSQVGRVAELKGQKSSPKKRSRDDLEAVPDVKELMPHLKRQILRGVRVVFSGVVPLGVNIENSDIGIWATSFGAKIQNKIDKQTTHVVAARHRRTAKVKQAAHYPRIKIVETSWLFECFSQWRRVEEELHLIHIDQEKEGAVSPLEELEEGILSASDGNTPAANEEEATDADREDGEDESDVDSPTELRAGESAFTLKADALKAIDEEMAEFMADVTDSEDVQSDSDENNDSDGSNRSEESDEGNSTRKRKRSNASTGSNSGEDSDASTSSDKGSKLQQRKKRALGRVTSLTNVAVFRGSSEPSGLPSPETTAPEEEKGGANEDAPEVNGDDDDNDDDGLEAEMMAEMEREEDEDAALEEPTVEAG